MAFQYNDPNHRNGQSNMAFFNQVTKSVPAPKPKPRGIVGGLMKLAGLVSQGVRKEVPERTVARFNPSQVHQEAMERMTRKANEPDLAPEPIIKPEATVMDVESFKAKKNELPTMNYQVGEHKYGTFAEENDYFSLYKDQQTLGNGYGFNIETKVYPMQDSGYQEVAQKFNMMKDGENIGFAEISHYSGTDMFFGPSDKPNFSDWKFSYINDDQQGKGHAKYLYKGIGDYFKQTGNLNGNVLTRKFHNPIAAEVAHKTSHYFPEGAYDPKYNQGHQPLSLQGGE